ncbi:hypothetical protein Bbelb_343360 [Branchiostoma belcheri]|nr:hypothetical protein Bbelb_343360 [Branchiostoma belcheri]
MNYYYLPKLLNIKSENPLKTFLENPWRYKNRSEVHIAYCNVTWDPSRNFMSFDLGYPAEGAEDKERARRYIHELEADFTIIMLLDYVDESYVLLKRLMCWELQDVLYKANNVRNYTFKSFVPSEKELEELRRWKAVDYLLYDTFNKSLWRKIAAQASVSGPDFFEEVRHFKDLNERINTYCGERQREEPNLAVKASKWNSQFEVDAEFCSALHSVDQDVDDSEVSVLCLMLYLGEAASFVNYVQPPPKKDLYEFYWEVGHWETMFYYDEKNQARPRRELRSARLVEVKRKVDGVKLKVVNTRELVISLAQTPLPTVSTQIDVPTTTPDTGPRAAACSEMKSLNPAAGDGEYTLYPFPMDNDVSIRVYCHDMASGSPKEFLSLPAGPDENYAIVSPDKLSWEYGCTGSLQY